MIKKILSYLTVLTAIFTTGVASYKLGIALGTKLGDFLIRRGYVGTRISEITVWNGPIPTHPSQQ